MAVTAAMQLDDSMAPALGILLLCKLRRVRYIPLKLLWQLCGVHCLLCVHVIRSFVQDSHQIGPLLVFKVLRRPSMCTTGQKSRTYHDQALHSDIRSVVHRQQLHADS